MRSMTPALLALCGTAALCSADVRLSEIFTNSPGTDNGQEFIELAGSANQSLSGLSIIVIEGDGTTGGTIDAVLSLSSFSLGSNGLFLWRDGAGIIDTSLAAGVQGPSAGTSINIADFAPDLENGSNTYLLVSGFTGSLATDLDADNDGILDSTPWASVLDAVALIENDSDQLNLGYADDFGFTNFGPQTAFNADILIRGADSIWYGSDVLGTNPGGAYSLDATRNTTGLANAADFCATPGAMNLVPSPGVGALACLALLATRRRR